MENYREVVLASTARTTTLNSDDQVNSRARGVHVVIDVSTLSSSPSVVPHIQGIDPLSGTYYDILVGLAITATGTTVLKVYPGIVGSANVSANDILPKGWRVRMIHANGNSITYSVGANMVL